MKPRHIFACAVAVIALAGCKKEQANEANNAPVNITPVAPPPGGDWTKTMAATPAGGFLMGNPNAKVKLVEYGSLTCPHCRAFDETGVPPLVDTYVKSGQVSWEFRNYVRDAFDLTASLIARCNGAQSFFPLSRALYKDQEQWVAKIQATPQAQVESLQNLPPDQQFMAMAKVAGLQDWAAARGLPVAKSSQCLKDQNAINQLVQMTSDATTQFPDFPGTPTFLINGKMVKDTATWELLEPKLKDALR